MCSNINTHKSPIATDSLKFQWIGSKKECLNNFTSSKPNESFVKLKLVYRDFESPEQLVWSMLHCDTVRTKRNCQKWWLTYRNRAFRTKKENFFLTSLTSQLVIFWRAVRKKGRHWSTRHDELPKKDSSLVNSSWRFWKKWLVTDQLVMTSSWSWRAWRVISWRVTSWLVMTSDELTSYTAIPDQSSLSFLIDRTHWEI